MSRARKPWPRAWRLGAVMAWSSFLGAVVTSLLLVLIAPRLEVDGIGWHSLGHWFLLCWVGSLIPVGFALSLYTPPHSDRHL